MGPDCILSLTMMVGPSRALINYTILLNLEGLSQKILNQEGLLKKTYSGRRSWRVQDFHLLACALTRRCPAIIDREVAGSFAALHMMHAHQIS